MRLMIVGDVRLRDGALLPDEAHDRGLRSVVRVASWLAAERALVDERFDVLVVSDVCAEKIRWGGVREVKVIVVAARFDEASVMRALRAGVDGFLTRTASRDELMEAVRCAWDGGAPLSPAVSRILVDRLRPPVDFEPGLTRREHEVLELLCHGSTYAEIAHMLGVAVGTTQTHVRAIYRKLDVASKAEATRLALEMRLVG